MKKILSVFIPVIILAASAGVFVVRNYCMITERKTGSISCCCNPCNGNCCINEIKVFRFTFESTKQTETKPFSVADMLLSLPVYGVTLKGLSVVHIPIYAGGPGIPPLLAVVQTAVLRI